MLIAASRSASAKTMFADLPPSSKTRGVSVSLAAAMILFAVPMPPVKLILRHVGVAHQAIAGLAAAGQHLQHAAAEGPPRSRSRRSARP